MELLFSDDQGRFSGWVGHYENLGDLLSRVSIEEMISGVEKRSLPEDLISLKGAIGAIGVDCVLVWHESADRACRALWALAELDEWPPNLAGAVVYRGIRFAAAGSREKAREYERLIPDRVHVLSDAVPRQLGDQIAERFERFAKAVESVSHDSRLPFHLLEASLWPQNLVAVYFMVKAFQLSPDRANDIGKSWHAMDENWKRQFWTAAWDEYHERITGRNAEIAWRNARLPRVPSLPMRVRQLGIDNLL